MWHHRRNENINKFHLLHVISYTAVLLGHSGVSKGRKKCAGGDMKMKKETLAFDTAVFVYEKSLSDAIV